MSNGLVPISDLELMASAVAASKLFGIATKEQALALMLVAQAEGLHPATAARDYHIIQGKPALKADAMLARYLDSGGKVEWHEHTDAKVSATFSHPSGGTLKIDWDDARVKTAGLADQPMHKKYPRQMKRARVISEGIRATNPAVATGIYTPEEVQDMNKPKRVKVEPKDMGSAEVVEPDDRMKVSTEQVDAIKVALEASTYDLPAFLTKFGLEDLTEIAAVDAPQAVEWLRKRPKERATAGGGQ